MCCRLQQASGWKPQSIVHTYIHSPPAASSPAVKASAAAAAHTYTDALKGTSSSDTFTNQLQLELDEFFAMINMIRLPTIHPYIHTYIHT